MADHVVCYSGPLVSRRAAQAVGLKRFFTGAACRRGHIAQKLTGNSGCVECHKAQRKKWRKENNEKFRSWERRRQKAWRQNNPHLQAKRDERRRIANAIRSAASAPERERKKREKMAETARRNEERKNDPEQWRKDVKRSLANRDARMAKVAGRPRPTVCDICDGNHRGIVFDHCHDSGRFRGWICDRCNVVLGFAKDDASLLRKMATYLDRANGKTNGSTEEQIAGFGVRGAGQELSN